MLYTYMYVGENYNIGFTFYNIITERTLLYYYITGERKAVV